MKIKSSLLAAAAQLVLLSSYAVAAVTYTSGTYSQTFDGLSGVSAWSNNSTLAGWYAATTNTPSITAIGSNTGSTTTAGLYSYGVAGTNAVTERALGYATSNAFTGAAGSGQNYLGLQLNNGNLANLTGFTLAYDGEQWRRDSTASQTIAVQYSLDATSLTSGTWTSAGASLSFTSPQFIGSAALLDGNANANRVAGLSATVSSIVWAPGTNLWIRFSDLNDSGNDHHLAIDNVSFTAVPEPTAAVLGGLGLLALLRRRRR